RISCGTGRRRKMLNREKYAKEIIEIACNGGNIAVVNGKLENCRKTQCNECNFNGGTIRDCEIKTRKWANSEYVEPIEPPVDWSRVPVDTPILVRHSESSVWDRRYFAKYKNGLVYAWKHGTTSWSAGDQAYVCDWKYAKLAESEESEINIPGKRRRQLCRSYREMSLLWRHIGRGYRIL
uniref:hypothetical protein n=1 Tax=Roseburia inulinivorans TaxID=360807 RepID=UPI004038EEAC